MSAFDPITCPIKGCNEDLYIVLTFSTPILDAFTAFDLSDPTSAHTKTWEIQCVSGHVVLLPADTAEDDYTFNGDPGHADAARLTESTGWQP